MKTYLKTFARMFTKHVTRFISIIFIVLVSVGFISGIGTSSDKLKYSLSDYYRAQNVSDLILKTENADGFTAEQIDALSGLFGEQNVEAGASIDAYVGVNGEKRLTRLYFLNDPANQKVNKFEVLERAEGEISAYSEVADNKIKELPLNSEIELDFADILSQLAEQGGQALDPNISFILSKLDVKRTVKIGATVKSPLTFARDGEPSYLNPADTEIPDTINAVNELITLENILFLPYGIIPEIPFSNGEKLIKAGDIYLSFTDKGVFKAFDKKYDKYLADMQSEICTALEGASANLEEINLITLNDNYSFVSFKSYADKVMGIGLALMVFFLFVTALVALSTMTRLMEEERQQIACLKTLGYSSFKIILKYLLFAMLATGLGGVCAYFVGLGLAYLICYVFNYSFMMMPVSGEIALGFFLIIYFIIVITTLSATLFAGLKLANEKPAQLLRPKPPRAGKKVFLERIPFVWKLLSFKYKSTLRNVLRYLSRFIMTVVAVAVSTALVLAGLALLDLCIFGVIDSPSVMAIAVVVIIFAGLLTGVVIYTLTNINISERNRELATLKVLGYHDREVRGYIYREVYIDTTVGIIFGYPLSTLIMMLLFYIIGMGTLGGVTWFWWLCAPVFVYFFTFLVTLMLSRKIVKIDMNESLKAIE